MQVLYVPQIVDDKIDYAFEGDKITITYKGKEDVFDFTDMPDGILEEYETTLDVDPRPIISARRENGEMYVELLTFIPENATHEEKFPKWKVVS